MAFILGIDPGASGALALLTDGGDLLEVADTPVVKIDGKSRLAPALIAAQIRKWGPQLAVIERVGAMPGQGVSSMFAFGYGAGMLEGICATLGLPIVFVQPAVWKRAMKVTKDKGSSLQMAQRMWPARAGDFARVKDNGRAEAALIGFYGRAQWQRQVSLTAQHILNRV